MISTLAVVPFQFQVIAAAELVVGVHAERLCEVLLWQAQLLSARQPAIESLDADYRALTEAQYRHGGDRYVECAQQPHA